MRNIFISWIYGLIGLISTMTWAQIQFESSTQYGQLLDVVYSPTLENQLYARSVNNHILQSSDLGQTWRVLHSVPQENLVINVKELRVSPDGNYLTYICAAEGTELNRVEVFDLQTGQIVKQIFSPIGAEDSSLIQSYSFAKNDHNIILMHTTKIVNWGLVTEVFYSQDAGENWSLVYNSINHDSVALNNVAISPFNSQKLYLMRGASPTGIEGGLWISEDGGQFWEEYMYNLNLSPIAFHPTNPNIVYVGSFYLGYGQNQQLLRTTNGGMSWVTMPIEWSDYANNSIHDIIFNPNDDQNIVVLEENEIAITHDGGVSWESHVYDGQDLEQYYYGIKGSFNPFVENQIIISANYYPFISNDGGVTLEKFETPFANSTGRMTVYNGENPHVYYGVRHGFVHKNMTTQEETPYGLSELGFFPMSSMMGPYADPNVEGRLFTGYSNMMGNVSINMLGNHGETSDFIHGSSYIFLMAVDSFKENPNKLLMSFGESLYKLDVADVNNVVSSQINLPDYGIVDDVVFGSTENEFYIVLNSKLFKTLDNGATWTQLTNGLESLVGKFIFKIAINPFDKNQIAIGTELGIFNSLDGGQTWTHTHQDQSYHLVKYSPYDEGVLIASSRFEDGDEFPSAHAQLAYSLDNGQNWEVVSTDVLGYLRVLNPEILFHTDQTATVYFLSSDLGMVSYTFDVSNESASTSEHTKNSWLIYPNPTKDWIQISNEKLIQQVEIYDFTGKQIEISSNSKINLSRLNKGIYLLKIVGKDGKIYSHKIIKQ